MRAEREAVVAAMINHPHVVSVFDPVADDDHQWLVMEYVEGESLADRIRREGGLDHAEAARIVWQVADGLASAHRAGITHRDVKPSNILVTTDGQAKLTDFGIARSQADVSLTQTGLVTGSPAYLAPEVASGSGTGPASDVWSLGATLFHVLAGKPPYDVSENMIGGLYKIVHEEPPRLSDAGSFDDVLRGTMAKDPARALVDGPGA
ncbi:serine/threonine-protein kinase [Nocardioides sp. B-3]|uniref:serine/threonine-protein kinase n=1 Tax=Nocardioides sp. B-3 TaxID=2895565 RepID=UPI00215370EE|nr:serine/threonine-protein kinase [Nocardioides sp. B-3]UUZ58596.1 serine/threonine protein kinase [Nocardioides sp. B-3]